jgi:hypothetical protein
LGTLATCDGFSAFDDHPLIGRKKMQVMHAAAMEEQIELLLAWCIFVTVMLPDDW